MKKLILILFSIYFSNQATSQFYQFSKSMGTYADLSNPIILRNTAWSTLKLGINLPFTFKYWGVGMGSLIYIDDKCSISLTSSTSQEVTFMFDKVVNRNGNSSINYSVEGISGSVGLGCISTPKGKLFSIQIRVRNGNTERCDGDRLND